MGLKATTNKGAKAYLKENCPRAFREYPDLLDARKDVGASRQQTVVLVDANVLLMQIPSEVTTLATCVDFLWGQIEWALGTGWLTVLVFDEPEAMTNAKKAEQARRDATRVAKEVVCSEDLEQVPKTDDFSAEDLDQMPNVMPLRDHRPTRMRLYDEIIKRLYAKAKAKADAWNASGNPANHTVLLLDGVDARGADRLPFAPRIVEIVGNEPAVVEAFKRATPIGEGDIKLQLLDERVRALATPEGICAGTTLVLTSTIDTDSLMIGALGVARRRVVPFESSVHSLLCMRTPPSKRQREEDAERDQVSRAVYLCCDVAMLEGLLQANMWGGGTTPTPEQALYAMMAFAAAAAMCGCDFVDLKGARFDHFYESIADFVKNEPRALGQLARSLSQEMTDTNREAVCGTLTRVCYAASRSMEEKPRYRKQAGQVHDVDDNTLKRAAWTMLYWSCREHVADEAWGFPMRTTFG